MNVKKQNNFDFIFINFITINVIYSTHETNTYFQNMIYKSLHLLYAVNIIYFLI